MRTQGKMDPALRRRIMSSIRKRDTVPELRLRSALWTDGIRGWRCHTRVTGTPDICFSKLKVAVFVDGVWWHGHPDYLPKGRRGPYWDQKIARNQARDKQVTDDLTKSGWLVVRIWDMEVISDLPKAVAKVRLALRQRAATR